MTARDRMVLMVVSVLVVLAAAWLLVVSPERQKASKLGDQVTVAQAQLVTAEGQVASARTAQAQYSAAYTSIVKLGKAVPAGQEVPSLIYQLDQVSNSKQVDFFSITSGAGGSGASAGSSASTPTTPAAASSGGLTQMPFTFVFNGSYNELYHLFDQLNRFTVRTASGGLRVSGRLLTIQSVKLAPVTGSEPAAGRSTSPRLTGTVTATAYVLPAAQPSASEATPSSPGAATPASSSGAGGSSATAPAIARVNP
jgi:hypothetical protein